MYSAFTLHFICKGVFHPPPQAYPNDLLAFTRAETPRIGNRKFNGRKRKTSLSVEEHVSQVQPIRNVVASYQLPIVVLAVKLAAATAELTGAKEDEPVSRRAPNSVSTPKRMAEPGIW